jgi:lipid-A-disaccharide synthase-like uncharacterized protein
MGCKPCGLLRILGILENLENMHDSPGIIQQLIGAQLAWLFRESVYWTAFGLVGNFLFGSRFFVQWLLSEKHRRVIVPPIFWHLSFWGSIICLIYALHVDRLPVILGYLFLPFIYARNLILLRKTEPEVLVQRDA